MKDETAIARILWLQLWGNKEKKERSGYIVADLVFAR